jgi:hypothetical protein
LLRKLDRVEVFRRIHDLETERRSFSSHAAGALDACELDRNWLSLQCPCNKSTYVSLAICTLEFSPALHALSASRSKGLGG